MKAPWWLWPNILHLDAPVIAVVWQEAFARAFGAALNVPERAVLFLVVWCIYAADRVADGFRLQTTAESAPRHRFARRFRFPLMAMIALAGLASLGLASILPVRVLFGGILLGGVAGLYFLWNQLAGERWGRRWAKEIVIGFVFAAGCALVPWSERQETAELVPVFGFAAVCVANCLLISRLERDRDLGRGESSLAVRLPPQSRPARRVAAGAFMVAVVFALAGWWPTLHAAIALAAAAIWCGVFVEMQFGPQAAAVWADLALLAPVLLFIA